MARAWLSDDWPKADRFVYPSPGGWGVALDDDSASEVQLLFTAGGSVTSDPYDLVESLWATKTITVKARQLIGYDLMGNPRYGWTTVAEGATIMAGEQHEELDDAAGSVKVVAEVAIVYSVDDVDISETAVASMSDGSMWRVVSAVRRGPRYMLKLELESDQLKTQYGGEYVEGMT